MEEKMDLTGQEQRKILFRLLSYTRPHKKIIILAFVLLLLTTLGDIVLPILVKIFLDDYLTPRKLLFTPLVILGSAYMGIQIIKAILLFFQLVKFQETALYIIQQLRIDLFSKVQSLGLKYFDKTPAGSIVSRVTNDTEAIKDMFVTVLSTFIQSGFLLVGIFIAMFILNVKLALFCVVILPILLYVMWLYRKLSSRFYLDMRERLSQLNAKLAESLQGMFIIQVFRQEKRLRQEFGGINDKHYYAGMNNIKIDSLLLRPAIDLIYTLALMIVLSFFGITSLYHTVEIGVIYAFVNYLDRFFEPVNQMMQRLSLYQQAIVAGSRVFKLLDEKELAPAQLEEQHLKIDEGWIEFQNLSFSYDGQRDVLKNISFTAKPGETVALVGHTGSGKSSIINLLMRFYEYEQGEILVDGKSIRNFSKSELRKKMGLVLQDPFLFYGTIKDNIRLHHKEMEDVQVEEASRFVQAHTFIEQLEGTYQHKVVERGATFSSGQRQLIAFARTIAANPKILVLDEATANIDTETEEAIQTALAKMRQGRTTIAIAHRLSTIQDSDLILVLHQGEIVERGTHQELLSLGGLYHKMFLLQNGVFGRLEDSRN
ncbi:ABC transporter ATP-binding protein [Bacillus sp. BRMEA1]|uniref:ABC transporter ATP-binding protein n=1 Tax=Neobacillus endophyticus TaxID=2738405 RepID=UPI0015650389|nr:ABC transporter ATP-binding protein [Neobacillus endophyticus]NRD79066.1 ABC transporter ATP-binding protein [Neobacillus endophyticus]